MPIQPTPRPHIVRLPTNFIVLRALQLFLSLLVLGITAYGMYYRSASGILLTLVAVKFPEHYEPFPLSHTLFFDTFLPTYGWNLTLNTAIISTFHLLYTILSTHIPSLASSYDYYALFLLELVSTVLWALSFCLLAAQTALARAVDYATVCSASGYCYATSLREVERMFFRLMGAAAGLCGLLFLLYLISLPIYATAIIKHRNEGGKDKPLTPSQEHPSPFSFEREGSIDIERIPSHAGKKAKREHTGREEADRDIAMMELEPALAPYVRGPPESSPEQGVGRAV